MTFGITQRENEALHFLRAFKAQYGIFLGPDHEHARIRSTVPRRDWFHRGHFRTVAVSHE
jgi:hypothetical protein